MENALSKVLVCPNCKNNLLLKNEFILCESCVKKYPIIDGIPVFINTAPKEQEKERIFRDNLNYDSILTDEETILKEVCRHHSIAVMRRSAKSFISNFSSCDWVLDIGTGFSWHWKDNNPNNCHLIGIDFSMTNLKVAKQLLTDKDKIILLCADASALPIKDKSIFGIWSVQVFQHFPAIVFKKVKSEIERVLKDKFMLEIVNLNPSSLLKFLLFISGKKFISYKEINEMVLNRLSAEELRKIWNDFFRETYINFSYSELFFHPPFFRPSIYPVILERIISRFPRIAKHFARQIHLKYYKK